MGYLSQIAYIYSQMKNTEQALLIEKALKTLGCNQTELAKRLEVTPAQITHWKKGHPMADWVRQQLREWCGLGPWGDIDALALKLAGSVDEAKKWVLFFRALARTYDSTEHGYEVSMMTDDVVTIDLLMFRLLHDIGIELPKPFPKVFEILFPHKSPENEAEEELEDDRHMEACEHPFYSLIADIYQEVGVICEFQKTFFHYDFCNLDRPELESKYWNSIINSEASVMELAAARSDELKEYAPKQCFRLQKRVFKEWEDGIFKLKCLAYQAGLALKTEYRQLLTHSYAELDDLQEEIWLNDEHLDLIHPDYYQTQILLNQQKIDAKLNALLDQQKIDRKLLLDVEECTLDNLFQTRWKAKVEDDIKQ